MTDPTQPQLDELQDNPQEQAYIGQDQLPFFNTETLQNLTDTFQQLNEQSEQQNEMEQQREKKEQQDHEQISDDYHSERNNSPVLEKLSNTDQNQSQQQQLKRACCRACIKKIRGKTCVCVVPASLRKQDISINGCRTCGCKGCGDEANIKPELQKEKKEDEYYFSNNQSQQQPKQQQQQQSKQQQYQEESTQQQQKKQSSQQPQQQQLQQPKKYYEKEVLQNGCCRECMKAFSKTGKSCLCQVPKAVRKFQLPATGCNICGCKGCNPGDLRKEKEKQQQQQQQSQQYRRSLSRSYSRSLSNRRKRSHRRTPSYSRSRSRRRGRYYERSRSRSYRRISQGRHRSNFDKGPSHYGNNNNNNTNKQQHQQQQFQQQQEQLNLEQMNFSNFQNSVFGQYVQKTLSIFPPLMGFGIPERTPSYILGKPLENQESSQQ